ncbi:hypothetical protein GVAV_000772 [Gurleya vavrai]
MKKVVNNISFGKLEQEIFLKIFELQTNETKCIFKLTEQLIYFIQYYFSGLGKNDDFKLNLMYLDLKNYIFTILMDPIFFECVKKSLLIIIKNMRSNENSVNNFSYNDFLKNNIDSIHFKRILKIYILTILKKCYFQFCNLCSICNLIDLLIDDYRNEKFLNCKNIYPFSKHLISKSKINCIDFDVVYLSKYTNNYLFVTLSSIYWYKKHLNLQIKTQHIINLNCHFDILLNLSKILNKYIDFKKPKIVETKSLITSIEILFFENLIPFFEKIYQNDLENSKNSLNWFFIFYEKLGESKIKLFYNNNYNFEKYYKVLNFAKYINTERVPELNKVYINNICKLYHKLHFNVIYCFIKYQNFQFFTLVDIDIAKNTLTDEFSQDISINDHDKNIDGYFSYLISDIASVLIRLEIALENYNNSLETNQTSENECYKERFIINYLDFLTKLCKRYNIELNL